MQGTACVLARVQNIQMIASNVRVTSYMCPEEALACINITERHERFDWYMVSGILNILGKICVSDDPTDPNIQSFYALG